jgi:hypothetical protein
VAYAAVEIYTATKSQALDTSRMYADAGDKGNSMCDACVRARADETGTASTQSTFRQRFWYNFTTTNDAIIRYPITFGAGLAATGEFARLTGIPGPIGWTVSGFPRLQGYIPLGQTLGFGSQFGTYTLAGSAATVLSGAAFKSLIIGIVFELGVVGGSAINAGVVQPVFGLGP